MQVGLVAKIQTKTKVIQTKVGSFFKVRKITPEEFLKIKLKPGQKIKISDTGEIFVTQFFPAKIRSFVKEPTPFRARGPGVREIENVQEILAGVKQPRLSDISKIQTGAVRTRIPKEIDVVIDPTKFKTKIVDGQIFLTRRTTGRVQDIGINQRILEAGNLQVVKVLTQKQILSGKAFVSLLPVPILETVTVPTRLASPVLGVQILPGKQFPLTLVPQVEPRERLGQEISPILDIETKAVQEQRKIPIVSPELRIDADLGTDLRTAALPDILTDQALAPDIEQAPDIRVTPDVRQIPDTTLLPDVSQLPDITPGQEIDVDLELKVPQKTPAILFAEEEFQFGQVNELYTVQAKEKGRFVNLSKEPLPINKAKNLGADAVDNSASAQFKIKKANKQGAVIDDLDFFKADKFNKKENRYIEKNIHRIDTPGEIEGISAKGWLARRTIKL